MLFTMTRKQTLIACKKIRVQRQHKIFYIPLMIRSTMVPNFCRLELPQAGYHPIKTP